MNAVETTEVQDQPDVGNVSQENVSDTKPESIDETIEKVKDELTQKFKTEIAGLNRRNSELEKSLKEKELEGKSEEEKTKALLEEKERILKDIEDLNKSRIIDQKLYDAGLPLDIFAKRIIGGTEEEIQVDIKQLNEYIQALVEKKSELRVNELLNTPKPETGAPPIGNVMNESDFNELSAKDKAKFMATGGKIK